MIHVVVVLVDRLLLLLLQCAPFCKHAITISSGRDSWLGGLDDAMSENRNRFVLLDQGLLDLLYYYSELYCTWAYWDCHQHTKHKVQRGEFKTPLLLSSQLLHSMSVSALYQRAVCIISVYNQISRHRRRCSWDDFAVEIENFSLAEKGSV